MNDHRRCILQHTQDPERPRPARRGWLCEGHYQTLAKQLDALPHDALEAQRSLINGSSNGPKVTGNPEKGLPYNETVARRLREARDKLASWAADVADNHPSSLHRPAFSLPAISRFLLTHLDWIVEQDWAGDFHGEFSDARYRLRASLSPGRSRKVPLGSCEQPLACDLDTHELVICDGTLHALIHTIDDGDRKPITCTGCDFDHHPMTWPRLSRRLRKDVEPMLTYAQLSQVLVTPIGTLKRWASEDDWRRTDTRPLRFHQDDAQASYERRHPLEESA